MFKVERIGVVGVVSAALPRLSTDCRASSSASISVTCTLFVPSLGPPLRGDEAKRLRDRRAEEQRLSSRAWLRHVLGVRAWQNSQRR